MHKINLLRNLALAAVMIGGIATWSSCSDEVAMAHPYISVSADTIAASPIGASYQFDIESNCDWAISTPNGDDDSWVSIPVRSDIGSSTVAFTLSDNETAQPRSLAIVISNASGSAKRTVVLYQASAKGDGYVSAYDLKSLAKGGSYTFTNEATLRAVVTSDQRVGNYHKGQVAVASSFAPGNGISLAVPGDMLLAQGDEIEVSLKGAVVNCNPENQSALLTPASSDAIVRTASIVGEYSDIPVTMEQLLSGDYLGLPVKLTCQIAGTDLQLPISPVLTIQAPDGNLAFMRVMPESSIASLNTPAGAGTLSGIAAVAEDEICIMPRNAADIALSGPRYASFNGISLPYVFSLMTDGPVDKVGKYCALVSNSDINKCTLTSRDGLGVTFSLNLSPSKYFNWWSDKSGHHNLQLGSFADGPDNNITFEFPLARDITDGLRVSLGLGSQRNACANWDLFYSIDNTTYYKATDDDITIQLPIGTGNQYEYTGGRNYFCFTVDIKNPRVKLQVGKTLYLKLQPHDKTSISGGTVEASTYRLSCLHSCVALEKIPSFSTTRPAAAVYFEPFDSNTGGVDYRLGEKLCGMLNHCGPDIAQWKVTNGLTGTNVRQRPGYAQIGYVDNISVAHTAYVNNVGELITPKLGASGDMTLSFKAMAYKTKGVFDTGATRPLDFNGDLTSAVVEVVGAGTINGASKATITGMSSDKFTLYTLSLKGANADTRLRFTSAPQAGEFSRWFIDEICITK